MSGWPLKEQARIAGVDDGPHLRGSERTPIFITIMRMDGYIEGFLSSQISTDGWDASEVISNTLKESRFSEQVRAILSDGACLGGFNVLDLEYLNERCNVPVITCSDEEPNDPSIEKALRENFEDWGKRLELIRRWKPRKLELRDGPCYIRSHGISDQHADWIVKKTTRLGRTPEPLRISHMAASVIPVQNGDKNG